MRNHKPRLHRSKTKARPRRRSGMLLELLESRHLLAGDAYWHNASHPADVDGSGFADTLDLALLVSELKQGKGGVLAAPENIQFLAQQEGEGPAALPEYFVDINGDNVFDTLDLAHLVEQLQEDIENPRVQFTYKATATNDVNAPALFTFPVGSTIYLHAFVEDRRDVLGEVATNQTGVISAALDLHYGANVELVIQDLIAFPGVVDPSEVIEIGDDFNLLLEANPTISPLEIEDIELANIDLGFETSNGNLQHLFTTQFTAIAAGQSTYFGERAQDIGEIGLQNIVVIPGVTVDPSEVAYGMLTITVEGTGNPPVANDDASSTNDNTSVIINVLTNDTDDVPASLSVSLPSATSTLGATLTVNANGTITYNPSSSVTLNALDTGDAPLVDSFTYTITNGNFLTDTATVQVTVSGVNDVPVAVNDNYTAIEGMPLPVDAVLGVLRNDIDPDDPLTATLVNTTTNGTLTFNADGSFNYVPDAGFTGNDQFTYRVNDGAVDSNIATATISVQPVGAEPIVRFYLEVTTLSGTPVSLLAVGQEFLLRVSVEDRRDVLAPSFDPDLLGVGSPVLDVIYNTLAVADPGSVLFNPIYQPVTDGDFSGAGLIDDALGAVDDPSAEFLSGDPIFFFSLQFTALTPGTLTFTGADDGNPLLPIVLQFPFPPTSVNPAQVDFGEVSVEIVDADPPVADDDTAATNEDTAIDIDVDSNDDDGSGGTAFSIIGFSATSAEGATISQNPDGTLHYDPTGSAQLNALTTGDSIVDTFTYSIQNASGLTDTATVSVTVTGVNDAPIADDDFETTDEETPIVINVLSNDSDPDGNSALLTITDFSATSTNGATITLVGGQLRYDPTASAVLRALQDGESIVDEFTYEVTDEDGGTSTATVFVTVTGISDAGQITGRVFFDMNSNGTFDVFSDKGIGGVQIILTGTNGAGAITPLSTFTRGDGTYSFDGLSPGRYTIHEVHPDHTLDGLDRPGNFGVVTGFSTEDELTLDLPLDEIASGYNFVERGLTSDFISNGSVLNSTTSPGIVFGFNEDDGIEWFSFMAGWNGFVWAELDIAPDLSSVTLTVYDAVGNAQQTTFPAIRPRFRFLGTNADGYVVHISGRLSDFSFTPVSSPSTVPGSAGAVPLDPSAVDIALAGGN